MWTGWSVQIIHRNALNDPYFTHNAKKLHHLVFKGKNAFIRKKCCANSNNIDIFSYLFIIAHRTLSQTMVSIRLLCEEYHAIRPNYFDPRSYRAIFAFHIPSGVIYFNFPLSIDYWLIQGKNPTNVLCCSSIKQGLIAFRGMVFKKPPCNSNSNH